MSTRSIKAQDIISNIGISAAGDGYIIDISQAASYSIQLVVASPVGLSGCTVTLSSSNDKVNFIAGTPVNVTTATTAYLTLPTGFVRYVKLTKAISGGSVSIKAILVATSQLT